MRLLIRPTSDWRSRLVAEAIRDMLEAKQFGVRYIIAPMVETPYALSKYIAAKDKVYSAEEKEDVSFLFNLETITAFENLEGMLARASANPGCDGVVFGRVDFSGSIGSGRNGVESERVTASVEAVLAPAWNADWTLLLEVRYLSTHYPTSSVSMQFTLAL